MTSLDKTKLPKHVGIIMDGNGRWAKSQGLPRFEGHRQGAQVVEDITECARETGIKFLTLYAFSKENWQRPADEVRGLMGLLVEFLKSKQDKMIKNGIRLNAIGDLKQLPASAYETLRSTIRATESGREMVLTLALSYGARDEITRAIHKIVRDAIDNKIPFDSVTEHNFGEFLDTRGLPDPDLVIRTSGENRISNFMLWQAAYAELVFVQQCWPEFTQEQFIQCLAEFQQRERRFGMISEQLED